MSWCSIEPDWMVSLRCVAPGISQTLMVIEIWRQVWTQSGKAQDTFASWLIDRRCLREAEAFSWDAGAKTIRPSRAFLDLNRGTTNGACFSAFNVLSLVHDFSCLDVEWDTFWSGYNYSSEVCWVTPSLATVSVYLLKLGLSGVQPRCHFCFVFFLLGLGLLRFLGNLHSLLFYYYYFFTSTEYSVWEFEAQWVFAYGYGHRMLEAVDSLVILQSAALLLNHVGVWRHVARPYAEPCLASQSRNRLVSNGSWRVPLNWYGDMEVLKNQHQNNSVKEQDCCALVFSWKCFTPSCCDKVEVIK